MLIHNSIQYSPVDTSLISQGDSIIELLTISASVHGSPISIFKIYIPLSSSCPPHYKPDFDTILNFTDSDFIVIGDFNAHHWAWFSDTFSTQDEVTGDALAEAIDNSLLCVLNLDTPTQLPSNGMSSSPDVSLISAHLLTAVNWSTNVALNSDHLPVSIVYADDLPPECDSRTFTNFRLVNWDLFIR